MFSRLIKQLSCTAYLLILLSIFTLTSCAQKQRNFHSLDYIKIDFPAWDSYVKMENKDISSRLYRNQTNIEKEAYLKYYHNNNLIYESNVLLRLSGNASRKLPQKSIAIRTIGDKINYQLFPNRDSKNIDEFVLRAHGNVLRKTFFNDAIANHLLRSIDIEYSAYRPVVVYLNNEYMGLYNLREKKDKDFLARIHNLKKDSIQLFSLLNNVPDPLNSDWSNLINYCVSNSLEEDRHYTYVSNLVDIDNFIDYNIAQCFFANGDWPRNNVKIWKANNGKFRFIFFDCDRCMINPGFNQIEHITGVDQWSKMRKDNKKDIRLINNTLLIRNLSDNKEFTTKFAIRYQDLLNTIFNEKNIFNNIDNAIEQIESEVQSHISFWKDSIAFNTVNDYNNWQENVISLRNFFQNRRRIEFNHLEKKWNLGSIIDINISVNNQDYGSVKINTISDPQSNFFGHFFSELPLTLKAIPNPGYEFDYWEGIDSKESIITLYNSNNSSIIAHFRLITN